MSFTSEQKQFIIGQQYKSSCCRRALLQGALFAKGEAKENNITLSVGSREIADFLSRIVAEIYGNTPEIMSAPNGGRRLLLAFTSKSASNYLRSLSLDNLFVEKCDGCMSSFLRGVFLTAGRLTDPSKQYFLEISLGDRCEIFADVLGNLGMTPKHQNKKTEQILYIKKSSDIEDFCGYCGLHRAMFAFMDAKVEGEFKKSAMRVDNCETFNISKAVSAASRQLAVIRALDKADLLSTLPDELEITARLRLENADMSLFQLSAISVPHVSKSGLSHRLNRIIEIGEQLLAKRGLVPEN